MCKINKYKYNHSVPVFLKLKTIFKMCKIFNYDTCNLKILLQILTSLKLSISDKIGMDDALNIVGI